MSTRPGTDAAALAMIAAASVTAQFVAAKAVRDALYLVHLPVQSLPAMVITTSVCSVLFAIVTAKVLRHVSPAAFVPAAYTAFALVFAIEWLFVADAPTVIGRLLYLQVSGAGPMLGSGFWLIACERFDPRTAKQRFGRIAAVGTLGGLAGGLLVERAAAFYGAAGTAAMLPVLAMLSTVSAVLMRRLAAPIDVAAAQRRASDEPELSPVPPRPGLRALARVPYLRDLAALVALGATGAALADYAFRAQVVSTFQSDHALLRFFAGYYAAVSVVTFIVQALASRPMLERFGLSLSASTPSAALLVGGMVNIIAPGLASLAAARGGESVFRGSMFRASYEIFYTPMAPGERRAAKSIIDVGFDRLGDAAAGVWLILLPVPAWQGASMGLAMGIAAATLFVTTRLNRGYVKALERSLLEQRITLAMSDVGDRTTRTTMLRTLTQVQQGHIAQGSDGADQIEVLRSRDRERVMGVLRREKELPPALIGHVIPLLAWDAIRSEVVVALRRVAEDQMDTLVTALIDAQQDSLVRSGIARVLSASASQRAADGLLLGLDDVRFAVRLECARSLASIRLKNPRIRIDRNHIFDVVLAELAVAHPMWEGHRLVTIVAPQHESVVAQETVTDRSRRTLAHVFMLLSLVLPVEPLQIAYRALQRNDDQLRATALEYLESVLPKVIWEALKPLLDIARKRRGPQVH